MMGQDLVRKAHLAVPKVVWVDSYMDGMLMIDALTERENQILQLTVDGLSYGEIADKLCVTERTVRSGHMVNIFAKLGVHNRLQATNMARRLGFVSMNELPTTSQDAVTLAQRYLALAQQLAAEGK